MKYEELIEEYEEQVEVIEIPLNGSLKGLYYEGAIAIDSKLSKRDKTEILAEELGHFLLTAGNILDQTDLENRKQEIIAKNWAYEKLVPISSLIEAFEKRINTRTELCEFLEVSEMYLEDVLDYYQKKHGYWYRCGIYVMTFKPLQMAKML